MVGLSAAFVAAGAVLIYLNSLVLRSLEVSDRQGATASAPAASAPATTAPADGGSPTPEPGDRRKAAAQSMSGLLLLLGLVGIGFGVVCVGWVVYDIYRSRPAWKTQTKYPRRR
jgi:hypothetical protein